MKSQEGRRPFTVEDNDGKIMARGVLYDDDNVQVLWIRGAGYSGIQYANISYMVGLIEGANVIRVREAD